ncbi:pyroglutamyl-peptidase I [Cellulomonas carbonis]|uniref:Pyrrolidone-carboxylate peptidase n=1 Tax=Cellulomonas carbonis T26 TaxID=947969 RepID=A0A0A0BW71_9CELL|nr:pyroglutamyl-peptidase I [Cellulomonas carbonis]KGM11942.1 Pyrrolidone-carboxylate peptidase [Cellulomonas carbonis T26]GGB95329.1 pyrrolidone-carboxylate peptidase [Cellulomonas carbonis]
MTRVLVTGFEPFDGRAANASWEAVTCLAEGWDGAAELAVVRLPVSFVRAPRALGAALDEHRPDVVVCVGEAVGRAAVGLERVAVNVVDARIPDADGAAPVDVPVVGDGPVAYLSTLPLKRALVEIARDGTPVEVSRTAGTYVCNATFYALMHATRATGTRAGFVHVPGSPDQVPPGSAGLDPAASARALRHVVDTACSAAADVVLAAGAEA